MQLTLDDNQVLACMALWRETLAMPGHIRGEAQQAFLSRVSATLVGWSDLLRMCRPASHDQAALQQLGEEILRFKVWIDDAIVANKLTRELESLKGWGTSWPAAGKRRIGLH